VTREDLALLTNAGARAATAPSPIPGAVAPTGGGAGGAAPSSRRRVSTIGQHAILAAVCLLPLASFILASRGTWLLDYRWEDNWSYLKYFYDWTTSDPILRDFMDHDYKGARVAWILLGYLVYHAFEPLTANLVLNGAVAAISVLLTLGLAARLFGRVAGAIGTIVASAFSNFYSSGVSHAWSYQGSICNIFYLLLLWGLTAHATGRARRRGALLAGAAVTLLMLTGTTYIVALPWLLAYWALLRGRPTLTEILEAAAFGLVGVILAGAALAGASVLAGGQLLFMVPLLYRSASIASGASFGEPVEVWLPLASWLAFPAIVLLGGAATAVRLARRHALASRPARPFVAAFVGFAGLWLTMIGMEATLQAYLQYEHYHYTMIGAAAIALAGILRWLPRGAGPHDPGWLPHGAGQSGLHRPALAALLIAVLVIVPQMLLSPSLVAAMTQPVTELLQALILPGTVVVSVLVASVGLTLIATGAWRSLLVATACFGVAAALTNPSAAPFHLSAACSVERENYLLVTDVTRWMASRGWHVNARSWYSPVDAVALPDGCGNLNLIWTFAAIEQAGMIWKVAMPMPPRIADLSQPVVRNIGERPRARLVILSEPGRAAQYNTELAAWARSTGVNPVPRLDESRTFTRGPLSLTVQVYRLRQE
jgi:hypothetical protein